MSIFIFNNSIQDNAMQNINQNIDYLVFWFEFLDLLFSSLLPFENYCQKPQARLVDIMAKCNFHLHERKL